MQETINVLVVDDEPVVIKSCKRVLQEEGYHVQSAMSGREAMLLMETYTFKLAFVDLRMPEIDGLTLIEWIKRFRPDIEIGIITGYPFTDTIEAALSLGCFDYVPKPFTPTMLTDVAHKALQRTKQSDPSVKEPTRISDQQWMLNLMLKLNSIADIGAGHSHLIKGKDFINAGYASKRLRAYLLSEGLLPETVRRAAIAAFEAEMNVVIHAMTGALYYTVKDSELRIVVTDIGPGIADIELAMTDGYSTAPDWVKEMGWGNGIGMSNIKKNTDSLKIDSKVGFGTTLNMIIHIKEY